MAQNNERAELYAFQLVNNHGKEEAVNKINNSIELYQTEEEYSTEDLRKFKYLVEVLEAIQSINNEDHANTND